MIRRVVTGYNGEGLIKQFFPCPEPLVNTIAGSYGDPDKQADLAKKEEANLLEFGYKNWYDWCVDNWGTKWDVTSEGNGDAEISEDGLEVQLSFDSAWSPPVGFYEEMERQGFAVEAFYHEPGMAFCGRYADGFDDYHEIKGNADWVEANIPAEINEVFAIAESMAMWEDEEETEARD
jgi:hypothetical protein